MASSFSLFFVSLIFLVFFIVIVFAFLILLVIHAIIEPLLNLIIHIKLLLNLLILKVFRTKANFGFENFRFFFIKLAEDFNEVEAGALAEPVEMLLPCELLFKLFNLLVTTFA